MGAWSRYLPTDWGRWPRARSTKIWTIIACFPARLEQHFDRMNSIHERLPVVPMMPVIVFANPLMIRDTKLVIISPYVQAVRPSETARGFTRFELLVVLGCLGMLAGLVLPALAGRSAPRSERVVCVNNLR